jgi:hypothetical protein
VRSEAVERALNTALSDIVANASIDHVVAASALPTRGTAVNSCAVKMADGWGKRGSGEDPPAGRSGNGLRRPRGTRRARCEWVSGARGA